MCAASGSVDDVPGNRPLEKKNLTQRNHETKEPSVSLRAKRISRRHCTFGARCAHAPLFHGFFV